MRKIKTKGRKWTVKKVDRGPTFAVALHKLHPTKNRTVEALVSHFDITEDLAKVAVKTPPIVLISDLDQQQATEHVKKLNGSGDFRVWLESATAKMRKMSFKTREEKPTKVKAMTKVEFK